MIRRSMARATNSLSGLGADRWWALGNVAIAAVIALSLLIALPAPGPGCNAPPAS